MLNYNPIKTAAAESRDFLIFSVGKEDYALAALSVQEIGRYEHLTALANMPPAIKGIKKIADNTLLILDLRILLQAPAEYTEHTLIIVTKCAGHYLGLVVDAVKELTKVTVSNCVADHDLQVLMQKHYLQEAIKLEERLLFVINIETLYQHEIAHLLVEQPNNFNK